MTAEKGDNNGEKRNVLVGITFDSQGRELISWAIVKVADPGDQVVAVHVCRKRDDATKEKVTLDCFLESYKGLCDIKKVNLHGQILKGNSIRKSLVKEAKTYNASAVVVGTSKQTTLGGGLSASKYCAKHLDSRIEVVSIHNGKVVFRRSSNDQLAVAQGRDPKPSFLEFEHLISSENTNTNTNTNLNTHSRSCSFSMESNLEIKAGWPLLRTSSIPTYSGLEARKMSVVQWVMNLPIRSPPETTQSGTSEFSFSVSESTLADSRRTSRSFCGEIPEDLMQSNFTWFSYEVLKSSTSHFSSGNLIGKGGCSRVYKGKFPDGKPVAVKVTKSSRAGWTDFSLEIDIISSLKHNNLTSLLGVCIENSELISVHEFMSKGSLEDNLHSKSDHLQHVLPWEARFKIAVGIADALNYIHNGCSRSVIHRDVKSSNILLSDRFEPKLSDFGLAVWGPMNSSFETYDDVVGTFGYLAPEYFMYGKVSSKVDVYSFGVVLLELLSGRKSIDYDSSKGQESLVMWAKPILESGNVREIVDPNLEGSFDEIQMKRMMVAATLCLTTSARLRPYMNRVVRLLKGEESIEKWSKSCKNGMEVNDDEVYVDMNRKSHLNVALVDVEDDLTSMSSISWKSS